MRTLFVHFLDGLDDDRVEVIVDGQHHSKDGVTTKRLLGYADTLPIPVLDGPARVKVLLPKQDMAAELDTQISGDCHLLASIENGELRLRVTDSAPGFM